MENLNAQYAVMKCRRSITLHYLYSQMDYLDQIWGMWVKNMVKASSRIFKQWRRDIRAGETQLWWTTTSGVWFEMTIKFTRENHVLVFIFDWFQNCLQWLSACCAYVRYIWMIYDIQFANGDPYGEIWTLRIDKPGA